MAHRWLGSWLGRWLGTWLGSTGSTSVPAVAVDLTVRARLAEPQTARARLAANGGGLGATAEAVTGWSVSAIAMVLRVRREA